MIMKKIFLFVYLLSSFVYCYAELAITLNVEKPGSLSSMIASSKKSIITSLTLTGSLNGSDILYIRNMAGASYKGTISNSNCSLEYLDISNANIVEGGECYSYEHEILSYGDYYDDYNKFYTKNNVISSFMFDNCYRLKTLILPKTVEIIEKDAFFETDIQSITLPDNLRTFNCIIPSFYLSEIKIAETNQYFITIDGILYSHNMKTLYRCPVNFNNSIFTIPEGVENIYSSAFYNCKNIKEFIFPTTLKSFGSHSLAWLSLDKFVLNPNIKYSSIGSFTTIKEVTMLEGYSTFDARAVFGGGSGMTSVERNEVKVENLKVFCITPPTIPDVWSSFNKSTLTGNLYVPKGTYSSYYIAFGWGDFSHIYELDNDENETKCAKPTISYSNGKLTFNCETDGVTFKSTITDTDISSFNSSEVQLCVTYNINVYATKQGYDNSDVASATLCWIDVEPQTEGISNNIAQIRANAVLILAESGNIKIAGIDDGTIVNVYGIDGLQIGSSISCNGHANINTILQSGSIAILKFGDKSVKVVMK